MEPTIKGYAELMAGFRRFPAIARGAVAKALEKALLLLQGEAADYPVQRSGSRYRRTGTLGRTWTSARREIRQGRGHLLEGRMGNRTPYGPYVQSEAEQLAVHRGRWKTIEQILQEQEGAIDGLLGQAGGEMVKGMARGG
jgi:hypothetical protein